MRYDAAIIGAGADGLTAAAVLAHAGLSVIVLERAEACGGRAATREFLPGFHASPFMDELAPIPAAIFWELDLARRGAIFAQAGSSLALWPDRRSLFLPWADGGSSLMKDATTRADAVLARALADAQVVPRHGLFARSDAPEPWSHEDWAACPLFDVIDGADEDRRAHLLAGVLAGRTADPFLAGSALHLLAPGAGGSGIVMGGLATLGAALEEAARESGAEISNGLEVTDIRYVRERVKGVCLADGTEVQARAVLSTLDLKRTFLSLFAWNDLPRGVLKRAANFRRAGGTARILLALDAPPSVPGEAANGPIHVAPDATDFAAAYAAWRSGTIPTRPPLTLRLVSASDPGVAPPGKAVLTATLGCIPHALFDGAWTHEKRGSLRDSVLARIEEVLPGTTSRVLAAQMIVPPDIEEALGVTQGDLAGGDLAADQMLGSRPFAQSIGGRTPVDGLYLAGPSSTVGPLASCAAGMVAARALMADLAAGRLK